MFMSYLLKLLTGGSQVCLFMTSLWAAKDKVIGAQCKVNWDTVYGFKKIGGLRILCVDKFARALPFRWSWL
jgi:hypothetical protein